MHPFFINILSQSCSRMGSNIFRGNNPSTASGPPPPTRGRYVFGRAALSGNIFPCGRFLIVTDSRSIPSVTAAEHAAPPPLTKGRQNGYASTYITFTLKRNFLTPTTNRVAVGPPSPTIGEGAIYAHRFLGRNIRELLCDRKVIKRGCTTFVPPLSKGRCHRR